MQEQNEFFEKGLQEILCSGHPSDLPENQQLNQFEQNQIPTKKKVKFLDIIVRLLAAFVAAALLISFSANITLK